MADFIRNKERNVLSIETNIQFLNILNQVENRIKEKDLFEITTSLEIKVIRNLITRARDTQKWYTSMFSQIKDFVTIATSLKSLNPGPLVAKVFDFYDKASSAIKGSSLLTYFNF